MLQEVTPPAGVARDEWSDWKWQVSHSITSADELADYIEVPPAIRRDIEETEQTYRWRISPYWAALMDPGDESCPIRKQALPSAPELRDPAGVIDPLEEEKHTPAPGVIRVYPDRVAWCVSNRCAMLCRHCLRKRFMTAGEEGDFSRRARKEALEYLRATPEIRDVLLTGGDPLLFDDQWLEEILEELTAIDHVEIVRIGTRVPSTLPQRITPELCSLLEKHHPLWINTQFNHPRELTADALEACSRLAGAGIPLGNQSVLLKGINDDPSVMKELVQGLLRLRVRPYYIYQCQLLSGTAHFRTSVETGINIIFQLRGFTSGLAVPTYLLDTPVGKVPMNPEYVKERDREGVRYANFRGEEWYEPNPFDSRELDGHGIAPWRYPYHLPAEE